MYKITITKEEEVEVTGRSYEKVADTGNERDKGPVYGYVEHPTTERRTTNIFEQRVENLDLPTVIRAVNGMPAPKAQEPKKDRVV